MFSLLVIFIRSDPRNKCSSQSNGNLGTVRYYENDDDRKPVPSFYTEYHNSYDWKWVSGSFCPRTTGTYTIKAQGFPSVHAFFNYEEKTDDGSWFAYRCTTTKTVTYEKQYLYANRCYPLLIGEKNNCVSGDHATGYINDKVIDNTTAIIMDCFSQDCLPNYYTDTCEKYNDAYCNNNGQPEYGRTSQGIGCVCNSHSDNIFCEDTSQFAFGEGHRGVQFKSYYNSSRNDNQYIIKDFSKFALSESYSTIELNSVLFVPQNTDLEFQLSSTQEAQLYIDNQLVAGSLGDLYKCEVGENIVVKTPKTYFIRGRHSIKIVMNPGCAIYDQTIELKWKFYRWYRNNPGEFEDIPARYLGF